MLKRVGTDREKQVWFVLQMMPLLYVLLMGSNAIINGVLYNTFGP
jgi:hypothetical protein